METDEHLIEKKEELLTKYQSSIIEYIETIILKIAFDKIDKNSDIEKEINVVIEEISNIFYDNISLKEIISYYLKKNNINSLHVYLYKSILDLITDYNSFDYNITLICKELKDSVYFDEIIADALNDNLYNDFLPGFKIYRAKDSNSYLYKLSNTRMKKSIFYYLKGINDNLLDFESVDQYDDLFIEKINNEEKDKTA